LRAEVDEMAEVHERAGGAVRGASRLAFDAVTEMTRIVEGMHVNIAAAPFPLGEGSAGSSRGITGFVYEAIRKVSGAVGHGADRAFAWIDDAPIAQLPLRQPEWDAALSALNGVLGDHLAARGNPLAIPMQLRRGGCAVEEGAPPTSGRLLLLVHGLCMNDRQWCRGGHDHGAALARELGYTPLYLFYNSGRHISENGGGLSALLERFVAASPTPIEELSIVGHSMGGLVVRSACHAAAEHGHTWPQKLGRIVFLGSPHHGSPIERVGSWVQIQAELSPYLAPLARLADLRSAGITDLRHGSLLEEDWREIDDRSRGPGRPVPLPAGIHCHAIAGTLSRQDLSDRTGSSRFWNSGHRVLGDGLVPLESALGKHRDPARSLEIPDSHRWVGAGVGHLDLLDRPAVYAAIRGYLSK
jgi:pimeloyl-ACP methyl ester carboxylesterase